MKPGPFRPFLLAGALLLALAPSALRAQSGILFVRVSSPVGPLSSATAELLHLEQVLHRSATDARGVAVLGGLPAGTYRLRVSALGYRTEVVEEVRIAAGSSRAVDVVLEVAPIEVEGLTVRAERIQIQRENSEFSTRVEEEAILLLPMSYDVRDLIALTPGARPDNIWGGSSFQANAYRMDGLSTTHPGLGGNLLEPNINWIDHLEVRGLGAGAEFGGFQGGLVDVITKTGSNEFQGSIRTGFEQDLLNNTNLVDTEIGTEVAWRYDMEGEARGPILRDRLFYYVSGKRVGQDRKALNHLPQVEGSHAPFQEGRVEEKLFGKLTWAPGDSHLLEVSGAYTDTRADNYNLTGFEAAGATHRYSSPTLLLNGSIRELLGNWAVLEARVNHFSKDERYDPYQGGGIPGLSNFSLTPPYNAFRNAPLTLRSAPASTAATLTGTFRLKTGSLEHQLKVGGEYSRGSFLDRRIRNGGVTWLPVRWSGFDPENPLTWTQPASSSKRISALYGGEVHLDADVETTAAFAQSSISLGPRIVLTPGLRLTRWRGWITPASGNRFLAVEADGLDPRLGVSVELTRDRTFVAKAHWGRYHQNLISQMFDRVEGADVFTNEEYWYWQGETFSDPGTTFTREERDALAQQGLFLKQGEIVLNETGPMEEYRQPYVDQWLVGLEKQMGNWFKAEALYTRRSNKNMIALVDRNRATNYTVFEGVRVFEAGGEVLPYQGGSVFIHDLYLPNFTLLERLRCKRSGDCPDALMPTGMTFADTLHLTWDPDYVLTTAPGAEREFSQIQVNLEAAFPEWGASLSFVTTDLEGNLDNVSGYTDPEGYGAGPYVRVNEGVNAYGNLGNFSDREWKVSVWGLLPFELRGGLFWTFQSGDHYSPRFRLYGIGFFEYRVNTGAMKAGGVPERRGDELDFRLMWPLEGHYLYVGPRGRPTLERRNLLDLRLERIFSVRGYDLAVSLEAFNILRSEAITQLNTIVNNGPDYGFGKKLSMFAPPIEPNQYFEAPQERVRPRSFRLGMSWYF